MQIIATPVTPRAISVELESARAHFHLKERCMFCDLIEQELASRERVVSLGRSPPGSGQSIVASSMARVPSVVSAASVPPPTARVWVAVAGQVA